LNLGITYLDLKRLFRPRVKKVSFADSRIHGKTHGGLNPDEVVVETQLVTRRFI